MVYNIIGLGYDELKSVLRDVSKRRRRSYFAGKGWIHRKLLEACVAFAKNGFRIVDEMVISRLCVAFRELRIAKRGLSILLDGEIKALEMLVQYRARGVFKWAPRLETWLRIESYRFWLGTIQHSLSRGTCLGFEIVGHQSDGQ
jgi:hypothetical protein